jgi:hypothetical protein
MDADFIKGIWRKYPVAVIGVGGGSLLALIALLGKGKGKTENTALPAPPNWYAGMSSGIGTNLTPAPAPNISDPPMPKPINRIIGRYPSQRFPPQPGPMPIPVPLPINNEPSPSYDWQPNRHPNVVPPFPFQRRNPVESGLQAGVGGGSIHSTGTDFPYVAGILNAERALKVLP